MEHVACPICDGEQEQIFSKEELGTTVFVVICKGCGLVYLSPRMSKQEYTKFYEHAYGEESQYSGNIKDLTQANAHAQLVLRRLQTYAPDAHYNSILEIGAGSGAISDLLQKQHTPQRAAVIEPSEVEALALRQRGFEVLARDVDDKWSDSGSFELIVLRQCLEHFLDPLGALRQVSDALTDDGIAYIAVPNMMRLRPDRRLDRYWFRIVHTYYFASETLTYLLAQAGLQQETMKEEASELWCIVRKGNADILKPNLYAKQMRVIRSKQHSDTFKRFFRSPLATLRDQLKQ